LEAEGFLHFARMKILMVHERLGAFGGAEANVLVTGRALKNRGHEVALLHGQPTGQGEALWNEVFTSQYPLHKDGVAATQNALWQFEPDVIFVHKLPDLNVIEALVASGIPITRMIHDHDLCCMRSYKYFVFNRRICQRPVSAYCLVPCGAFLKRQRGGLLPFKWVSYGSKRRELKLNRQFKRLIVATLYMKDEPLRNGFDPERIEILPPATQAPGSVASSSFPSRNLLVFAGQVIRGKGVDILLESLAMVKTPFECVILGDGNHRGYCEALSKKLGIADRVRFMGFVPQDQLAGHYLEASLAVVSSVWPEPFGAVGLEAMRYGLPVVGFDAGGIREWLISGYNGFLVPWMDRAAFARRVEELLLNKKLAREMGERGRRLVDNKFNFSAYISNLEHTLTEVVEEARERVMA
jgi:glycosyltransferase involved in cell wall biosynthesis